MTIRCRAALTFVAFAALAGCAPQMASEADPAWVTVAMADLHDARGNIVGKAELRRGGALWALAVGMSGQTPGPHGIHFHTTGTCTAPAFASANGHLNPAGKSHGSDNPAGMHMGDLPNIMIGADGMASTVIPLAQDVDPAQLFDTDGTALVLHAGADDYRTDPAGNSGPRIACGVFTLA